MKEMQAIVDRKITKCFSQISTIDQNIDTVRSEAVDQNKCKHRQTKTATLLILHLGSQ